MIRTFLAVPLPLKVKKELGREIDKIKTTLSDWQVNWVRPENLHVTLIFFGWIPDGKVPLLQPEIRNALAGFPSFEISTGKLSAEKHPIWIEVKKGRGGLTRLHSNLNLQGYRKEKRSFSPHLTIGRVKRRGKLKLPKIEKTFLWKTNRLVLYESKISRKGPVYKELFSFDLIH
ncbi:MAG: RNA 2',3'-cyclic phosphodiesterase [Patescibacteria group bacterium]|nr:MAG: RNA 2',3'-cyclic phosphodiesterase [Patescibacteria group bacterium]